MKKSKKVNASIILPYSLWKKVKECDPTGQEKFTNGILYILNKYFEEVEKN